MGKMRVIVFLMILGVWRLISVKAWHKQNKQFLIIDMTFKSWNILRVKIIFII